MTKTTESVTAGMLARYSFFAGMTEKMLQDLASISEIVELSSGKNIFNTGDTAHGVIVLRSGKANILIEGGPAGDINVSTIDPGEALGWSGVIEPHYFCHTARVTEAGSAIVVSAPKLRQMMSRDHELATTVLTRVAQMLATRLRDTRYQLIGMLNH